MLEKISYSLLYVLPTFHFGIPILGLLPCSFHTGVKEGPCERSPFTVGSANHNRAHYPHRTHITLTVPVAPVHFGSPGGWQMWQEIFVRHR